MSTFALKTDNDSAPVVRLGVTLERRVDPDTAEIGVAFEGTFPTREECASDHGAQVAKVKLALAPFGLEEELKSGGYACYRNRNRKNAPKGFAYSERASLVLPLAGNDLGAVVGALEDSGSTASFWVRRYLADESAVEEELAAAAVERSRRTAERLAKAAGAKVLGVRSISFSSYSPAYDDAMPAVALDAAADLAPEQVEVEARVTVEWLISEEAGAEV